MRSSLLYNTFLLALLAFLVNTLVYFGFGNIYSSTILNHEDFLNQFQSGIYQYRILSGHFLLNIYDGLSALNLNYNLFKFKFFNEGTEPQMYLAFYILNTTFAVLTAIVLSFVLHGTWNNKSDNERLNYGIIAVLTMAITQYVIVPYDYSSYFFIVLFAGILFSHSQHPRTSSLIVMMALVVLSTLNRESSALSIAMASSLLLTQFGWSRKSIVVTVLLGLTFLATYLGLRLTSGTNFTTNDGNLIIENITQPKNWLGAAFSGALFLLTLRWCSTRLQRRTVLLFHAFALPYILMCLYSGILYEVRLYIPLFIISVLLSQWHLKELNTNKIEN